MASRRKASKRNVGTRIIDIDSRLKRAERKFSPETLGSSVVSSVNIVAGSITPDTLDPALSGSLLDVISGNNEIGLAAEGAFLTAEAAANAATNAQLSADGKNTIYYQTAAPTGGTYRTNDIWFDTDDGYKMYVWNGSAWTASVFGNSALGTLDVGKLTAGTINASMQMTIGTVANGTSRVVIDGGGSGDAGIRLISRSAGGVDSTLVNLSATTGSATFTGSITAASGTIGGFTIGASSLSATNILLDNAAPTLRLGPTGAGAASVFYASSSNGLWLGHHTSTSAPFRVTLAGALTATSATVTGTINATAGYIGSTASNGWTINSDFLRSQGGSKQVTLDGTNAKIYIASGTGTHGTAGTDFYADATGLFSIRDKLIFNPGTADSSGFATLTVIGKIRGAIDNVPIVLPNAGTWTVTQAVISGTSPNQTAVVTTSLTHDIAVNDTVIIANVTGGAAVINGAWKVTAKTSTTFTITGIAGATNNTYTGLSASGSTARVRELTLGLHPALNGSPAGLGVRLDENNYWFVNNAFKVGGASSYVSWNGTTLETTGTIKATAGYIGGTSTGWSIGSTLLSNGNIGLFAPATTTASATTSGTTTTSTMVVTSATNIAVGMSATHENLPLGTSVTAIASNTLTLSNAPTAPIGSGSTILFAHYGYYAGSSTRQDAFFRVDYRGNLVASSANVTGRLAATSGSLGSWSVSGTPAAPVGRAISADPRFGQLTGSFLENKTDPNDVSSTPSYVAMFTATSNLYGVDQIDGFIAHRPSGDPFLTAYLGSAGLTVTSPDIVNLIKNGGFENYVSNVSVLTSWNTTNLGADYASTLTGVNIFSSSNPSFFVGSGQWAARLTWTTGNPSGYVTATIDGRAVQDFYQDSLPTLSLNYDLFFTYTTVNRTMTAATVTDTTISVTTSVAHGFSVGDVVRFDAVLMDDNGNDFAQGPFTVLTVPTTTTFTVRNNFAQDNGLEVFGVVNLFNGFGASPVCARMYVGYQDMGDIRIRFANGFTIPLYNVLTTAAQTQWANYPDARYRTYELFDEWDSVSGLKSVTSMFITVPRINLDTLRTAAGANWNGVADFFIDLPAWMYRGAWKDDSTTGGATYGGFVGVVRTGQRTISSTVINAGGTTGTITLTADPNTDFTTFRVNDTITISGLTGNSAVMNGLRTITAVAGAVLTISGFTGGVAGTYTGLAGTMVSKLKVISGVTYSLYFDSAVLALNETFFAGDFGGQYSWYDPDFLGTLDYASASVKSNSPFIDFSTFGVETNAEMSNLDKVYFKPVYDKPMLDSPSTGSDIETYSEYLGVGVTVNPLTTYSGRFQFLSSTNVLSTLYAQDTVYTSRSGSGWEAWAISENYNTSTFETVEEKAVMGLRTNIATSTFYVKADLYSFKSPEGVVNFQTGYTATATSGGSSNTANVVRSLQDSDSISRSFNNTSGTSTGTGSYTSPTGARYVAFKTPPSGMFLVHLGARLDNSLSTGRCYYTYEIRSGSSTGTVVVSSQFHNALYLIGTNATKFGHTVYHKLTGNTTYWIKETMEVFSAAGTNNTATVDYRRIVIEPIY